MAIHRAAASRNPEVVRLLLKHGADPHKTSDFKAARCMNALAIALMIPQSSDVIEVLIREGKMTVDSRKNSLLDAKNKRPGTNSNWARLAELLQ